MKNSSKNSSIYTGANINDDVIVTLKEVPGNHLAVLCKIGENESIVIISGEGGSAPRKIENNRIRPMYGSSIFSR